MEMLINTAQNKIHLLLKPILYTEMKQNKMCATENF